jgi:hypothetical protein
MLLLLAIAVPVLVIGALFAKARQTALRREANAAQDALDDLSRSEIT